MTNPFLHRHSILLRKQFVKIQGGKKKKVPRTVGSHTIVYSHGCLSPAPIFDRSAWDAAGVEWLVNDTAMLSSRRAIVLGPDYFVSSKSNLTTSSILAHTPARRSRTNQPYSHVVCQPYNNL